MSDYRDWDYQDMRDAEIEGWRQRYEALIKHLAEQQAIAPPRILADKQSYELGLLRGAAAEREACAVAAWSTGMALHMKTPFDAREIGSACAKAIRARGNKT